MILPDDISSKKNLSLTPTSFQNFFVCALKSDETTKQDVQVKLKASYAPTTPFVNISAS